MVTNVKVGRYVVRLSNLEQLLFDRDGITKADLIAYYARVAPRMLPLMHDRMVSMQRFPRGIYADGFFQKNVPDYFPSWIKRKSVHKQNEEMITYVVCNNAATLIYLANYATITMHLGLSRIDKLLSPDQMIFDLDPARAKDFARVCEVAGELKTILDKRSLPSFIKTTGGKGLHVVVPLKRTKSFDEVRAYAGDCARELMNKMDTLTTLEVRKEKREGKIFIDTLRNAYGQTAVAPYSVRAYANAPVALPIEWHELGTVVKSAQQFTLAWVMKHFVSRTDAWKTMRESAVRL